MSQAAPPREQSEEATESNAELDPETLVLEFASRVAVVQRELQAVRHALEHLRARVQPGAQ